MTMLLRLSLLLLVLFASPIIIFAQVDTDNDGILDDGDLSGIVGDNNCTGGATVNCDDNCQFTSNGNQEDADFDGLGDHCDDCCDHPGDPNGNAIHCNILDITYLIAYLYKGGPAPSCMDEGDPNADCKVNILDIIHCIAYLYKDGPQPVCGCVNPQ